jgi:hypothetical protein
MGDGVQTGFPAAIYNVYSPAELVLLALTGLVIAVVGALAPAGWAARVRTAIALRAELSSVRCAPKPPPVNSHFRRGAADRAAPLRCAIRAVRRNWSVRSRNHLLQTCRKWLEFCGKYAVHYASESHMSTTQAALHVTRSPVTRA